jgi:hypothetical protein
VNLAYDDACETDGNDKCSDSGGCAVCEVDNYLGSASTELKECSVSDKAQGYTCGEAKSAASSGNADSDNTTLIIAIVVTLVVLFVIAIVVVLFMMNKNQQQKREAAQAQFDHYSSIENSSFDATKHNFEPGVTNPLYDWYHPKMSAAVAKKFLQDKDEGKFIVRDAENTAGWHKMCVKTQGSVQQDNIKLTRSGQYELVAGTQQPKFKSLPELVDHYSGGAPDAPDRLSGANALPAPPTSNDPYGTSSPYDMSAGGASADSIANPMYGAGANNGLDLSGAGGAGGAYGQDPYAGISA